ncbi:hypothetical protein DB354_05770 [Opitutus sp. ER46]|nr:hypothetical protein DB354_05770 [Opitutus sp. ER46]
MLVTLAFVAIAEAAVPPGLMDFSSAGYRGGGVPLPHVPARFAVGPSGGDDTRAIQAALDAAGRLPLDAAGWRGAVVLRPGTYRVGGQLRLAASGVVLRGERATLVATGDDRRTLIQVGGRNDRGLGRLVPVRGNVAVGTTEIPVETAAGFAVGQRVLVRRPSTAEWIAALGMTNFPGPGQYKDARLDWVPGSRDIEWERTIVAVDAANRTLTLDAPLTTALEEKFGGGAVHVLTWPGRVRQVGVEFLDCISETDATNPQDEEHAWMAVALDDAEDAWVRDVTARRFVLSAVWIGQRARAVTVQDCAYAEPVAEEAAWRRVSFYVGGQQALVQRCTAAGGRRDFAAGHCAAGPIVFLDCTAVEARADAGPFESWASGVLYDRVSIAGAGLGLMNLGVKTQGAGWNAANCVVWNSAAAGKIWIENPPGAENQAFVDAATPSLYRAQLESRAGRDALTALARSEAPQELAEIAAAPAPGPAPRREQHPIEVRGGYFVVDGRALFGGSLGSALWKGQLPLGRETGTSPTRWAPGRTGPGLTEDLAALTERMRAQRAAIYWAFPGLWYDRRRDDHSIALREDADVWAPFAEMPWARSGRGRNAMQLSKYDLTRFNPWYFRRLRELADECAARGLLLAYQVYDNHNVQEAAAHWTDFPWRPLNCVQEVGFPEPPAYENAGQNRHHIADAFYDSTHPVRRDLHERYIRHTLDVLGAAPNVLVTLGYQFAGPLEFQRFFLDTVAAWQREHGCRVYVALQTSKAVTDAILADPARAALVDVIDLRYWQYLPDGQLFAPDGQGKLAFRELRTAAFGRDALLRSRPELVYRQVREYRDRYPGKAIICGHAGFGSIPVLMAGGAAAVVAESTLPRDGAKRDEAALLAFVAEHLATALPELKPMDDLAENAWVLAGEKRGVLLYASEAAPTIRLKRALPAGTREGLWFNPEDGTVRPARVEAGATTIAMPTAGSWLLWLPR